jgi:hypothetical protein
MSYIVWRNGFKRYDKLEGNGYFVSYADKISDYWSDKYFEAKKYKTLSYALNRLGLDAKYFSIKNIKAMNNDLSTNRNDLLSKILDIEITDEEVIKNVIYSIGRIDIVDDDNNLVGDAIDEIVKHYISNFKTIPMDAPSAYIDNNYEEDFWEGF